MSSILSVEDIEFVHPVNLDDEGEGLPAYEESVSSGLSSFASDEGHYHDEAYVSRVNDVARKRLSEKEHMRLIYEEKDKAQLSESGHGSSILSPDTSLPPYQPPPPSSSNHSHLTRSLSRKYGLSREAQVTELTRTGLARVDFGSAYAQQSTSTITCALSLYGGALILFGTADGLRVASVSQEVPVRVVWTGMPVWDIRVLRCIEDGNKTPRGSVAILCGGHEDPNRPGKPRTKGGEVEVRIWRLGSLASLARWTAEMPMGWKGLDMVPISKKGKGKERSFFSSFSPKKAEKTSDPGIDPNSPAIRLATAWASDFLCLDSTTTGKPADVLDFSLRQRGGKVYIAIATTTHVLLHVGIIVTSGVSFRSTRKFYLPFPPTAIGLLDVLTPTGETSLGIWISFGSGGMGGSGVASVIRNSDSAVLDFKPPSGQGAGKGGGEWSGMQNVWTSGKEVYAFHRGGETMIYPSPLRLPISVPPVIHTTWPRTPLSSLVVPDGNDLLLITTSASGEICTQRARVIGEGYQLNLQDGTAIGEGRILPLAWGYIRDGVYVSIKEMKEWRICAIEKV